MEKNCVALMMMGLFLLMGVQNGLASPMYYTFNGTVTSSNDMIGGVAPTVGSALSYTLLIDFTENAEYTKYDGTIYNTYTDIPETADSYKRVFYDYFYVDFYCGTVMSPVGGGYYTVDNAPTSPAELNLGEISKRESFSADGYNDWTRARLSVLGSNDHLEFQQYYDHYDPNYIVWQDPDFAIGSSWRVTQRVNSDQDPQSSYAYISGGLTLTAIQLTPPDGASPVPEPGTLLLLSAGIVGLVGSRRLLQRKGLANKDSINS